LVDSLRDLMSPISSQLIVCLQPSVNDQK
jgi:hypothetical protein